jgi:hypothetical protein
MSEHPGEREFDESSGHSEAAEHEAALDAVVGLELADRSVLREGSHGALGRHDGPR